MKRIEQNLLRNIILNAQHYSERLSVILSTYRHSGEGRNPMNMQLLDR
jgi:hypothetical protein